LQDVLDRVATLEDVTHRYCEDLYARLLVVFEQRRNVEVEAAALDTRDVLMALSQSQHQ
jgi:hypothetical protein